MLGIKTIFLYHISTFLTIKTLFVFKVKLCICISSLRIMIGVINYYCLSFICVCVISLFPFCFGLWAVEKHVNKK